MSVQIKNNGKSLALKRKRTKTKESKERRPNANDPSDYENSMSEKVQTTLLIGDSMIKNIQGSGKVVLWCNHKTHEGFIYLKPNLKLSPDQVILHVGTDDLKQKESQQVADSIVDLARQIGNSSDASITISELVSRRDKFNEAVTITNKHLKSYCRQNGWELIQHRNISEKGLNQLGGLHLNVKGNQH